MHEPPVRSEACKNRDNKRDVPSAHPRSKARSPLGGGPFCQRVFGSLAVCKLLVLLLTYWENSLHALSGRVWLPPSVSNAKGRRETYDTDLINIRAVPNQTRSNR